MLITINKFKINIMKSKLLSLATIALFAITSISCSKSDEPAPAPVNPVVVNPPAPTPTPTTGTFIKATTDGVPFLTGTVIGTELRALRSAPGSAEDNIALIGYNATYDANGSRRLLKIELSNITTPGTYTFAGVISAGNGTRMQLTYSIQAPAPIFTFAPYQPGGPCNSSTAGTVTITAIDATKIEGTFSFTGSNFSQVVNCSDIKTVTNGSFRGVF
jgi:hypothetical protein